MLLLQKRNWLGRVNDIRNECENHFLRLPETFVFTFCHKRTNISEELKKNVAKQK